MPKVALVTGGNSGIGFSTAGLLGSRGYQVWICGRDEMKLRVAAKKISANYIVADISCAADIKPLAACFLTNGLDVLVNNAALARLLSITDYTHDDISALFNTNLRGPLLLTKALIPALALKKGSITNVSSLVVLKGSPRGCLYAATKGGLEALTRSLAVELAPSGIRINAVTPGAIDTPLFTKAIPETALRREIRIKQEATIPLGRYGTAEEVAQVIVAQLEATYVTGSVWAVDGGLSAC